MGLILFGGKLRAKDTLRAVRSDYGSLDENSSCFLVRVRF